MSLKSPFTTKVERGAYSATVFKDGDLYVAEDNVGTLIKENSDAATVIQQAIDDYAELGQVVVIPSVTLSTAIKIQKLYSQVKFLGQISSQGIDAIELGDDTHNASFSTLELNLLSGVNHTAHGIVIKQCNGARIFYNNISYCDIGVSFDPTATNGTAGANLVLGSVVGQCNTAIKLSGSARFMEGNYFYTGICSSDVGFELVSGGNSKYQMVHGYIDCLPNNPSYDIKDNVGRQIFMLEWVRRETCTIQDNTLLLALNPQDNNHSLLTMDSASISFLNTDFKPILVWDFNRDSTSEWSLTNCTMGTPSKSVTRLTASAADWYFRQSTSFDGGGNNLIIIRYKWISGGSSGGTVYYSTSGHGTSASYVKNVENLIADGKWHLHVLDMSDLTAGGTDWIDNTITEIRFDLTEIDATVLDIDFIAVGGKGYGSMCYADGAIELYESGDKIKIEIPKTPATAGASGNKGDICWDANFIYVCVATDTWKRVAIAAW